RTLLLSTLLPPLPALPPQPPPFPYTTLFRSAAFVHAAALAGAGKTSFNGRSTGAAKASCCWRAFGGFPSVAGPAPQQPPRRPRRSEEHTSELQSQSNLVCRLLLEKKNTTESRLCRLRDDTLLLVPRYRRHRAARWQETGRASCVSMAGAGVFAWCGLERGLHWSHT